MQKQVAINQLLPGMRVVQLDIGWQKIPQWQQPFVVESAEDIVRLHQHCKNVVIEVADTSPATEQMPSDLANSAEQKPLTVVKDDSMGELKEQVSVSFVIECYKRTLATLIQSFDQIRDGAPFDGKGLTECASNLLLSAYAHPEVLTLMCNLKEKDTSLEQKSLDVAVLSLLFGKALSLKKNQLEQLVLASLLHDIGMLRVPQELVEHQEKLTANQRKIIQKHVESGCYMLSAKAEFKALNSIIAYHHERYDGRGYPSGIKGENTPLPAKVLQIATLFEALTRDRQYSDQHSTTNALSKLYGWRNKALDGQLVERFIGTIGVYPVGTLVYLNNGYTGIVMVVHSSHRSRPTVQLLFDREGTWVNQDAEINLTEQKHKKLQITKSLDPEEFPDKVMDKIMQRLNSIPPQEQSASQ